MAIPHAGPCNPLASVYVHTCIYNIVDVPVAS